MHSVHVFSESATLPSVLFPKAAGSDKSREWVKEESEVIVLLLDFVLSGGDKNTDRRIHSNADILIVYFNRSPDTWN